MHSIAKTVRGAACKCVDTALPFSRTLLQSMPQTVLQRIVLALLQSMLQTLIHRMLLALLQSLERCVIPTGNWCNGCEFNYEENGLRGRALCTRCERTYGQCTHCARSPLAPNTLVELRGLKALHMNGLLGEVLRFEPSRDRFAIKINYDSEANTCLLYTSPSPRDVEESRMPSSA